jgi:hypothetical protein
MKYIIIMIILAAGVPSSAQDGPVLIQHGDVRHAINTIWALARNGSSSKEAAFVVNGSAESYTIKIAPVDNGQHLMNIKIYSNTFAVFHVHSNEAGPCPSTPYDHYGNQLMGDTQIGDKYNIDMYVVSQHAICVYYWRTKKTDVVMTSWQDPTRWLSLSLRAPIGASIRRIALNGFRSRSPRVASRYIKSWFVRG